MIKCFGALENIYFTDINTLDGDSRLTASILIMSSLPAYYQIDGVDDEEMVAAVERLIGKAGSETEQGFAAVFDQKVAGISAFIPGELLPSARLIGAQALLKSLSGSSAKQFGSHLKKYNTGFGAVPEGSLYLSRFAVVPHYKGKGLSDQMMERFLLSKNSSECEYQHACLHVDKNNHRAISFYSRHGFDIHHTGDRYLTMIRSFDNF